MHPISLPTFAEILEESGASGRVRLLLTKRPKADAGGPINSRNEKISEFLVALCVAHAPHSDLPHSLRTLEFCSHLFDVPLPFGHHNQPGSVFWSSTWAVVGDHWHTLTTTLNPVEAPSSSAAVNQCKDLLNRLYPDVGRWHHRATPRTQQATDRSVEALAAEMLAEQKARVLKAHLDHQLAVPEPLVGPARLRL